MTAPSLAAAPAPPATCVATALFGDLTVNESRVVRFDDGLLGFPSCRRWILLGDPNHGLSWLQSADHPSLAFLLLEPFAVFDEFMLDVPTTVVHALGAAHAEELAAFAIVTLEPGGRDATANLHGPLLVNLTTRRGAQLVVSESVWSVRQAVPATLLRQAR